MVAATTDAPMAYWADPVPSAAETSAWGFSRKAPCAAVAVVVETPVVMAAAAAKSLIPEWGWIRASGVASSVVEWADGFAWAVNGVVVAGQGLAAVPESAALVWEVVLQADCRIFIILSILTEGRFLTHQLLPTAEWLAAVAEHHPMLTRITQHAVHVTS